MAPSNDSSASTAWGGTRAPLGTAWGAVRSGRCRVSSKAWTTADLLCRSSPGDGKAPIRVDKPCTTGQQLGTTKNANRHAHMMCTPVYQRVDAAGGRARRAPWSGSGRDLQGHDRGDVAKQLDRHLEAPGLLDVLGQQDVPAVHLDPLGGLDGLHHVGGPDGAEEPPGTGRPGRD